MNRDQILAALRAPDVASVLSTIEALGATGDRAWVGALAGVMRHEDPSVRASACEALGHIGDARAVGPLVGLLRDTDEAVRAEAFSALLSIGQARAGQLPLDAFRGEDLLAPSDALTQVVWPTDLEAIALLIHSLADEDPEVRIGSLYTLGRLGISAAFPQIAALMTDPDPDVRAAIALALTHLDRKVVVRYLSETLLTSSEPGLREAAAYLMGRLGETQGLEGALADADAHVRKAAALAMGSSGGRRFRPALESALQDPEWSVRVAGAEGLRRLADPAALAALTRHADDPHRVVRNAVLTAIRALSEPPV